MSESLLSVLPSSDSRQRLVVVLRQLPDGSELELQQQSYGDGVGWFTQARLPIQREQLALLRSALGTIGSFGKAPSHAAMTADARAETAATDSQHTLRFPTLEPRVEGQAESA